MTDDNLTPTLGIILSGIVIGFFPGLLLGTVTARQETEEKVIVYCMEQPKGCKVKYDYYKLEAN
jgi:hypothetical protein